jgi:hypothetical protein
MRTLMAVLIVIVMASVADAHVRTHHHPLVVVRYSHSSGYGYGYYSHNEAAIIREKGRIELENRRIDLEEKRIDAAETARLYAWAQQEGAKNHKAEAEERVRKLEEENRLLREKLAATAPGTK